MRKLKKAISESSWTLNYEQLEDIKRISNKEEDVSLEQVESVVLAMVFLGFCELEEEINERYKKR